MHKYVFTGGCCSGKSAVIQELARRGERVLPEAARIVHEERSRTFKLDDQESKLRQMAIWEHQLLSEQSTDPPSHLSSRVFLDRGLVDVISYFYFTHESIPVNILPYHIGKRYDCIFLFERLPFFPDGVRIEQNEIEAKKTHDRLASAYACFGFSPIYVPLMTVNERADFILNQVALLEQDRRNH